jgi:hypothetical protein
MAGEPDMEENKVATEPVFCVACGKQLSDEDSAAAQQQGAKQAYCSYACYCDD